MTSLAIRLLIAAFGVAAVVAGLPVMAGGDPTGLVWLVLGVGAFLVAAFEQVRYRSDPTAPGLPFQRTDEAFIDPTTGRRIRVYVNPSTGERRYHAES
ncbi:MAG: hypothetical protein ACRDFZ_04895 [Candidatus Limnocylindria bacterium]